MLPVRWDVDPVSIATMANLVGDIFRYVSDPFLCRLKAAKTASSPDVSDQVAELFDN
jgi:hypothetical protein